MKLLGVKNDKYVIASISHYDCVTRDKLLADGGQPSTINYSGYNRLLGERIWFEVPQTFAELYNDYNQSRSWRKYGVWKLNDSKILSPEEYPNTKTFEYKVEQAIWGANGIDGDQRTKYVHLIECETSHLKLILQLCVDRYNDEYVKIINHILENRNENN